MNYFVANLMEFIIFALFDSCDHLCLLVPNFKRNLALFHHSITSAFFRLILKIFMMLSRYVLMLFLLEFVPLREIILNAGVLPNHYGFIIFHAANEYSIEFFAFCNLY